MPIRRRITIDEIDDTADIRSPTTSPMMPPRRPLETPETETLVEFPSEDSETKTRTSQDVRTSVPAVGRTFPDLLVEFKNDNRAIVVAITFLTMVVFVAREMSLDSLLYALAAAFALNLLWFSIPAVVSLCRWIRRRFVKT